MVVSESEKSAVHSQIERPRRRIMKTEKALQIAIDGPAGAGKSTVAKRVADELGYLYIDTGAMYRAVTWLARERGISFEDHEAIAHLAEDCKIELEPGDSIEKIHVFVDGKEITSEIRSPEITRLVSTLSTIGAVRERLVDQQRQMAQKGGVVLDGRDIGTVVLPDANLKIFLTASAEVRAHRRLHELKETGVQADYQTLLQEIIERDHRDSTRTIAPLCMAEDAILILTDHMTVDEVVRHICKLCG
ncbi:MAG TPA: (d)CMP kinase [Chroococcales cyanobacterium]